MIKNKLPYFVPLFLLAGCQNRPKIDLHYYMLPTSDLLQGKVYCYVDSTGAYKQFEYAHETISGSDTIFEAIDFDSSFADEGEERDRLTRDGITLVSIEISQNGVSIPTQVESSLIPWVHPLQSDGASFHERFALKFGDRHFSAQMDARFDSVTDESLLGAYRRQDCVQESQVIHHSEEGPIFNGNHPPTKQAECQCKGVGKVGFTDSHGRKRLLQKIISKEAFDSLKSQH